jgi:hypothetical protein
MNQLSIYGWLGLFLAIISFVLAGFLKLSWLLLTFLGVAFAIGLLLFTIGLNSGSEISYVKLIMSNQSKKAKIIFFYSALIGLILEIIGNFVLRLWYYPALARFPVLFIGILFFYGIFGIVVRETYIYLKDIFHASTISTLLTAITLDYLIGGINAFTGSWIYQGIFLNPLIVYLGWVILVLFFYVVPSKTGMFP